MPWGSFCERRVSISSSGTSELSEFELSGSWYLDGVSSRRDICKSKHPRVNHTLFRSSQALRLFSQPDAYQLYIGSSSGLDTTFVPLDNVLDVPKPSLRRKPHIHRIDNGSLLTIFCLAMSLPLDVGLHEIRGTVPRGYLGLVCRQWHEFVLRHPSLWSTIILLPRSLGTNHRLESSTFTTYLRRSGAMPLSIYILPRAVDAGNEHTINLEHGLADALREVGPRIRSLVVEMHWRSSLERIGNVFDPREYPILERSHLNATFNDVGPFYPSLLTGARYPSRLTLLSINATDLLDLLASTQAPHHTLTHLTSLTINYILPHSPGFPDDGLDSILCFVHSLIHLISLRIERFHILGGHRTFRSDLRPSTSPHPVRTLAVRSSNTTAIAYLLRHFAPTILVLDACTFTTTPALRIPKCVDHLELSHIVDERASSPIFRALSHFNGHCVAFDACSFLTRSFLMRVLGRNRLNFMGSAYPRLRHLRIKNCARLSAAGLVSFIEALTVDREARLDVLEVIGYPVLLPQVRGRALRFATRVL
ncbi:hypothetical protein DFP72DRAFT_853568 [Ephemerocybe angulata]|uniref:F-box domain-containing protein n=1 Tax=Ephemerocybe angulata TaxID=980116 RepID=A0A8H6HKY0_9AGAR|nr:hypothetical protein DFP72DRAFT_853568 [Tulosesus angulatus]